MHNKPIEHKIGVINELPIRIYKCDEVSVKKHSIQCPYFLDGFEVTRLIGKKIDTLIAFISAEHERKSVKRNVANKVPRSKIIAITPMSNAMDTSNNDGLKPVSFEIAALYWLQYAIMGNGIALKISRYIIEKPLEKVASEIFWKKTIFEKQLQIEETVKIAREEESALNASKLVNKNGETIYTLNGSIEKARIIMRLESTSNTRSIIESGVNIQSMPNQVARVMLPTISKETHDAIMDIANRYREKCLPKKFNAA